MILYLKNAKLDMKTVVILCRGSLIRAYDGGQSTPKYCISGCMGVCLDILRFDSKCRIKGTSK